MFKDGTTNSINLTNFDGAYQLVSGRIFVGVGGRLAYTTTQLGICNTNIDNGSLTT